MKKNMTKIALFGLSSLLLSSYSCSSLDNTQHNRINNSPYFRTGKFRNDVPWDKPSIIEYLSVFWDFMFKGNDRTPKNDLPAQTVDLAGFEHNGKNQLKATWLGHSTLMINIDGYRILMDPVFEKRASFFGPTRFNGDIPVKIDQLPKVDIVIISHDHYDHLNKFSIQRLNDKTERFMVPLGVGKRLKKWGVNPDKIVALDWWEETYFSKHLMIAATPAQHFSGRGLIDRDKTLWASWIIQAPNHKIFFSGDSGYFDGFKEIGRKYGPFDITFMECGAYNEKWHYVHMYPEETVQAHLDVKGNILHPIHWATFNLSLHSWFEPMNRLSKAAASAGVSVATPMVGDTTVYNNYIPQKKWWEYVLSKQ